MSSSGAEQAGASRGVVGKARTALGGGRAPYVLAAYYLLAVAGLVALRAAVASVDFLGVGWILVLAAVPLLPAVVPRLGAFLRSVSPYVQSFKVGALSIDLRSVGSQAVNLGEVAQHLVSLSGEAQPQFSGTDVHELVTSLRQARSGGAAPTVVVDLKDGRKWRLPNLYLLSRLLEREPLVDQVIFTEMRGGTDGYLVGTSGAAELRQAIEQVPGYSRAAASADIPTSEQAPDLFETFRKALPEPTGADDDPVHGWIGSERIRGLLGANLSAISIEVKATLSESDLRVAVQQPYRFVPVTASGSLKGVVDGVPIARAIARAAVATS